MKRALFLTLPFLLLLAACAKTAAPPPAAPAVAEKLALTPSSFAFVPGWANDNHVEALRTFLPSCEVFARKPQPKPALSKLQISKSQWQGLCAKGKLALASTSPQAARLFFEQEFTPYALTNGASDIGLFTGYYEPVLKGSRVPTSTARSPLYSPPKNASAYTRAQIEAGALKGQGLEIAWVEDPAMLFFLQIQGSGRIDLGGGREMRVGYAGKNGKPYISLGKVMQDQGFLQAGEIDFFTIRNWLQKNPGRAAEVMNQNPSYVFFKELADTADSPPGAAAVPLTPLRSLAVDKRLFPFGLPLFIDADLPATPTSPAQDFNRLMIAQDTGGAIRGAVRGDVFFGRGPQAENWAGLMKQRGRAFLLLPRGVSSQAQ